MNEKLQDIKLKGEVFGFKTKLLFQKLSGKLLGNLILIIFGIVLILVGFINGMRTKN